MIPAHLTTQSLTWQRPTAVTDTRGDTTTSFSSPLTSTIRGWIERQSSQENDDESRDVRITTALLLTNELGLSARDRVVWNQQTWTVEGKPRIVPTPFGSHHLEVTIQLVEG